MFEHLIHSDRARDLVHRKFDVLETQNLAAALALSEPDPEFLDRVFQPLLFKILTQFDCDRVQRAEQPIGFVIEAGGEEQNVCRTQLPP